MALTMTASATSEPVTLAEAKRHLRVDIGDEDTDIQDMIAEARELAETLTGRQLLQTTYRLRMDRFPSSSIRGHYWDHEGNIRPPRPPLSSVSSITYVNTDGTTATLATTVYRIDTDSEPGRISLEFDQSWPSTRTVNNAVTVTYVAGYGSSASDVPPRAKRLVNMLVADLYENRDAQTQDGAAFKPNPAVQRIAWSLRVPDVAV